MSEEAEKWAVINLAAIECARTVPASFGLRKEDFVPILHALFDKAYLMGQQQVLRDETMP